MTKVLSPVDLFVWFLNKTFKGGRSYIFFDLILVESTGGRAGMYSPALKSECSLEQFWLSFLKSICGLSLIQIIHCIEETVQGRSGDAEYFGRFLLVAIRHFERFGDLEFVQFQSAFSPVPSFDNAGMVKIWRQIGLLHEIEAPPVPRDGISAESAKFLIGKCTGNKAYKVYGIQNDGRYFHASVLDSKGKVVNELLVDKLNGNVKFIRWG